MIKKILFATCFLFTYHAYAQLVTNLLLPPMAVVEKPQLWNMVVTNISNSTYPMHVELILSDKSTGQPVMSASTQILILSPGTKQLNATSLGPIQYNNLSSSFNLDAYPNGLLPVGEFEACYSYLKHGSESVEKIAEECRDLLIDPLSPPQLLYPYNETAIDESNPLFSWLPPAPQNIFTNLSYDFSLVEIYPNQSVSEALEQNYPLYKLQYIPNLSLPYPQTSPKLEFDKRYAWKIIANSSQTPVAQSQVWEFTLKQYQKADSLAKSGIPYVKLQKVLEGGYAIFSKELKFDYLNETSDSTWNFALYDLSKKGDNKLKFSLGDIPLNPGQNLVNVSVSDDPNFIDKHFYLLEVANSRNEVWRLRFQYYAPKE